MNVASILQKLPDSPYTAEYSDMMVKASIRTHTDSCYLEKHHILPKSIYPIFSKIKTNIVLLTMEEHFYAHRLLINMFTGDHKRKMAYAIHMLLIANRTNLSKRRISSIHIKDQSSIDEIKKHMKSRCAQHSKFMKEWWTAERKTYRSESAKKWWRSVDRNSPEFIKRNEAISIYNKNKIWTDAAIQNRIKNCLTSAIKRKGKPRCAARRAAHVPYTQSDESNQRRSKSLRGRKTSTGMLGKNHRPETIAKIKDALTNKPKIPNKGYWYSDPTGKEVLFCPIKDTSYEYGLCVERLRLVRLGVSKQHKGWRYIREATLDEIAPIKIKYKEEMK